MTNISREKTAREQAKYLSHIYTVFLISKVKDSSELYVRVYFQQWSL